MLLCIANELEVDVTRAKLLASRSGEISSHAIAHAVH